MVTFENLSRNLTLIMSELIQNQSLCKYLYYTQNDPLSQADIIDTRQLINNHILPHPFDLPDGSIEKNELRVYYPKGNLQGNQIVGNILVHFDVVVPKKLWMLSADNYSGIRPYEILHQVTSQFQNKPSNGFGKIRFDQGFVHLVATEQVHIVRVIASMTTGK